MESRRVVITGLGVVAPNGVGIEAFHNAQVNGVSGIRLIPELQRLKFSCQVAGVPPLSEKILGEYMNALEQRMIVAKSIRYGLVAGLMAWHDAGLELDFEKRNKNTGIIFGAGISGVDKFREAIYIVDEFQVRRLGSTVVINTMASGISAFLSGKIGAGNQVTTNSSACVTGTESIGMAYQRIKHGYADIMLAGSTSEEGPYIWGGFDSMRIMNRTSNDFPSKASRPLSAAAKGFVPGSGAGALVLETLESAKERGARIYAEIIGEFTNSGGHRSGGSMTAPNGDAVQDCIKGALKDANISSYEIDYINGHLTATTKDGFEIANWKKALNCNSDNFPYINSTKSTIGHCLSASGSIEAVATVLQMENNVLYPSMNCEDLHEEVLNEISKDRIPTKSIEKDINIAISASFGFGDVNGCLVFRKLKS